MPGRCRCRFGRLPLGIGLALVAVMLAGQLAWTAPLTWAEEASAVEQRMASSVQFLSADDQEGRGLGSAGLDRAADYLAEQFRELGLRTDLIEGGPFQPFPVTVGTELGEPNYLKLVAPPGAEPPATAAEPAGNGDGTAPSDSTGSQSIELTLGRQFTPLSLGGSGTLDVPLVFAGYGITAPELHYDDYAGIDARGKAVIVLRHEPQQDNPHSPFDGTRTSDYAPFTRKMANASEHGAAAVVFVTDENELAKRAGRRYRRWERSLEALTSAFADQQPAGRPEGEADEAPTPGLEEIKRRYSALEELLETVRSEGDKLAEEFDPLLRFSTAGDDGTPRDFPVLHCTRQALEPLFSGVGHSLAECEAAIDRDLKPQSFEAPGWRLEGQITVNRQVATVKNVVAALEGKGPRAEETIVIGAHYDHLGRGGEGSLAPDSTEIHNGADDNASGAAALVEVARQLAAHGPLARRIVFIAFTAEERGLLGSARYVRHPAVPLEQTVAMLNMDMVGRLEGDNLIVHGTGTATEFDELLDRLNEPLGFKISRQPGGFGPSDHSSFYAKDIPVLHFFTGTHGDYHRPSDDFEKINLPGMRRVAELVTQTALALAESADRPTYVATKAPSSTFSDSSRPYFGSVPDFSQDQPGYALMRVTPGSPAEKAGIQGGDIIIKLGESQIASLEDFDSALRKYQGGDRVPVVVRRQDQQLELQVTLEPPR